MSDIKADSRDGPSYYRDIFELMEEAYARVESLQNPPQNLLEIRKYITPHGLRFPDVNAECNFRKRACCKKTDRPEQMVMRYYNELNKAFIGLRTETADESERGLAG
jgi:hypothetical protein